MELFSLLMCRRSSVPLRISESASSGRLRKGVFSVAPYFSQMAAICQKIIEFFCLPSGTIPPSAIDLLLSGMIFSTSTILTVPSPLQQGQAPRGELNEKLWGAGSR